MGLLIPTPAARMETDSRHSLQIQAGGELRNLEPSEVLGMGPGREREIAVVVDHDDLHSEPTSSSGVAGAEAEANLSSVPSIDTEVSSCLKVCSKVAFQLILSLNRILCSAFQSHHL